MSRTRCALCVLAALSLAVIAAQPRGTLAADCPRGTIVTVAGTGECRWSGDGGLAVDAALFLPDDVAVGPDGSLYVADQGNNCVRKITPEGVITTVAGTGESYLERAAADGAQPLYRGDGGAATEATVPYPSGVAVGPDGNLYVADIFCVRKVDHAGIITIVAGREPAAIRPMVIGDHGPAIEVDLSMPSGVAFGPDRSMYVADSKGNRVRKVDAAGIITTVAGSSAVRPGVSGDGGPAVKAYLWDPTDVAIGPDGAIYIAESGNHRIRKVDRKGIITTVAGSGPGGRKSAGCSGDGGPATKARLRYCQGIAIGADGTIYIADTGNHRIRAVDPKGIITTIAGSGPGGDQSAGFSGDGGPAAKARLCRPRGLALGLDGSLYVADTSNHRIRKLCGVAAPR